MTNRRRIKNGPVAYFDILGYKTIIDNNEIETVAQLIVDYLDKTPTYLRDFIKNSFPSLGLSTQELVVLSRSTSRLVLSDSVLLTATQPRGRFNSENRLWEWFLFVLECRQLMNWMVKNGLPLKGAIGYGEYFRKRNCFAGKPILDAFRLAHNLDIAGCAFVPNAWSEVEETLKKGDNQIANFIRSISFKYEVPLKMGCSNVSPFKKDKSKSLTMVAFTLPDDWEGNIRKKARKAFTDHEKKITEKVKTKFENTVMMMESFTEVKTSFAQES